MFGKFSKQFFRHHRTSVFVGSTEMKDGVLYYVNDIVSLLL